MAKGNLTAYKDNTMELSEILHKHFEGKQPTLTKFIDWIETDGAVHVDIGVIFQFNSFLQKPLELKHLVPVKDGQVLEEPIHIFSDNPNKEQSNLYQNSEEVKDYQKAREAVIYEGFEIDSSSHTGIHFTNCWFYAKKENCYWDLCNEKTATTISDFAGQPITLQWWKSCLAEL